VKPVDRFNWEFVFALLEIQIYYTSSHEVVSADSALVGIRNYSEFINNYVDREYDKKCLISKMVVELRVLFH
jgi:hypothetical protein